MAMRILKTPSDSHRNGPKWLGPSELLASYGNQLKDGPIFHLNMSILQGMPCQCTMFGIHYPLHPILEFMTPWEYVACIGTKAFVLIPAGLCRRINCNPQS